MSVKTLEMQRVIQIQNKTVDYIVYGKQSLVMAISLHEKSAFYLFQDILFRSYSGSML